MQLNITIDLDNAAHTDNLNFELEQNFSDILAKVQCNYRDGKLRDSNGNPVGSWVIAGGF
jgi:hypothetical protein